MRVKRWLVTALLGGAVALAVGATLLDAGVSRAEEPEGVSLRQESADGRARGFFPYYHRSHRGGGLRDGK